jgi:Putative Flp pilus-assembly TadE/G-like
MNPAFLFKRFARSRDGQFALIMSILSVPLFAAVGIAIDYSYAVQAHVRLRAANDSAALFAAIEYKKHGIMPPQARVLAYLTTNFDRPEGDGDAAIVKMDVKDKVLTLDSHAQVPVFIMGIFGYDKTDISTTSSVTIGDDTQLEISLALDTTHSMTQLTGIPSVKIDPDGTLLPAGIQDVRRIDALKVAALRFTNIFLNDPDLKERSRIAIVPFARYVNVGLANRNAPWLSVPPDTGATGQQCSRYYEITGYGACQPYTWYYDGVPVSGTWCPPIYGTNYTEQCTPTGAQTWSGCVGSRNQPLNLTEAFGGVKFQGLMNTWCNSEILPLTGDAVTVANHISSLWTNDYTYIPEGVMWGWRMLTKAQPFTQVMAPQPDVKVRKIMIVMTDGENQAMADIPAAPTHHVLSPDINETPKAQYDADVAKANQWTLDACGGAKADDVELYTISFGSDINAASKLMLKNCASDAKHYYDAADATKLIEAFDEIAYRVTRTYLSN